jgi:hypothetical protein
MKQFRLPLTTVAGNVHTTSGSKGIGPSQGRAQTPEEYSVQGHRYSLSAHCLELMSPLLTGSAANAVHGHDNLEFLEDLVPKTVKFKDVKAAAAATRASLRGERSQDHAESEEPRAPIPNGTKKHKASASRSSLNGSVNIGSILGNGNGAKPQGQSDADEGAADPNDQLQMEMRQARGQDDDVEMAD